jgi:antitoxin component of RelBE/YafQ-DinJ toxin-antitoxin module
VSTFNMRLDDDLEAEVVAWAQPYGLSKAAAIRVLLRMALKNEEKP